jgi:outer membrane protein insertion porin family
MLFRIVAIFALLGLLLGFSVGPAGAEGEKIAEIVVKGNRRIEKAAILNVVKFKPGDFLYADKVDADVRAIYQLGQFQDVRAETSDSAQGTVLTYTVLEKPVIRDIAIEGNKEISADKIREVLEIKPNTIYTPQALAKSVKKVKKLYADDGYYLAEVEPQVTKRSDAEVRIRLVVTEGKKVLIRKIVFEGNKAFTAKQLKKPMETSEEWFLSWLTSAGTYKEDVLKNDVGQIAELYYNNGYINVKVGEPKVEVLPDKSGLQVTIVISEGDQFRVGAIGFSGDLLQSKEALTRLLKIMPGMVFSRSVLRNDIFTLTDLYADQGYAFANVAPLFRSNPEQKTVDITFDLEKGQKVYLDRITILGNVKTRDKVIRRELRIAEGDLYNATALRKSKQNAMNLGFFEDVNITTAKGSGENTLNLDVQIKEKSTGTFSIGGGYSSLDGFLGQGSVSQANFLGLALKLNVSAAIGGKSQTYNLGLTDPWFMDTRWTLGGDLYRVQRDYTGYTRRAIGGDVKGGYPLSDTLSTFWIYKYEEKKFFNIQPGYTLLEENGTVSSILASLTRNTTDYRQDPSRGMVNNLSIEFAGIGGTQHFVRYITDNAVFFPLFWGSVLSVRGTFGYMQTIGNYTLPTDEKFYLGGINTLRGYESRTVSPYENLYTYAGVGGGPTVTRVYTGGSTELYGNLDFVFPLLKEAGVKGVLFFDIGNSYATIGDTFSRFQMSYGAGIRWLSPMGPLRLEYGIPINPRPGIDKSGGKLEFSIGSFF